MTLNTLNTRSELVLESGDSIPNLRIAYSTFGKRNSDDSNIVWVCHALTGNTDVCDWWNGLVGTDYLINPENHFIICANVIGSCYGSSGPSDQLHTNGQIIGLDFPIVTIKDQVESLKILANHLNIKTIQCLIGGSLGGQQALEWAIQEPLKIKNLVLLASNAVHSAWGRAFNETQRMALKADPSFETNTIDGGKNGLACARAIAILSYRHYEAFEKTQSETTNDTVDNFRPASYVNYQGQKLVKRFDAYSYYYLSKMMDSHNVARGNDSIESALKKVKAKTIVIGISSDVLYPPSEQQLIAQHVEGAKYFEIDSIYGHDGFLIETQKIESILKTENIF